MTRADLTRVSEAKALMVSSREEYVEAVIAALDSGESATTIAHAAEVTEAAIRKTAERYQGRASA